MPWYLCFTLSWPPKSIQRASDNFSVTYAGEALETKFKNEAEEGALPFLQSGYCSVAELLQVQPCDSEGAHVGCSAHTIRPAGTLPHSRSLPGRIHLHPRMAVSLGQESSLASAALCISTDSCMTSYLIYIFMMATVKRDLHTGQRQAAPGGRDGPAQLIVRQLPAEQADNQLSPPTFVRRQEEANLNKRSHKAQQREGALVAPAGRQRPHKLIVVQKPAALSSRTEAAIISQEQLQTRRTLLTCGACRRSLPDCPSTTAGCR